MQDVKKEIKLQETYDCVYRIVITNSDGIVDQIIENKALLDALNIVSLLATGPDYMFDEKTMEIAI